ncbi:hypothetical protein CN643_09835 [Parageobacillus yumthangensis]|nr:hypothetical protein CN643_09835 [Parageobacillus yumthangensis]
MSAFKLWTDPQHWEKTERKRKERERLYAQKESLRKQTACFTGHRPNKLGGYNMRNPIMLQLKKKLLEVIEIAILEEGITRFISGGALGFDQASFWCVHILKKEKYPHIKNIVAIPFANQPKLWTDVQKYWYKKMLSLADDVIDVSKLKEYSTKETSVIPIEEYSKAKMQKRNEYMVDHSRLIIAAYDGSKGGTANCLRYAMKKWDREIWILDPKYNFERSVHYTFSF